MRDLLVLAMAALAAPATLPARWTDADWRVLDTKVRWARRATTGPQSRKPNTRSRSIRRRAVRST